MKKPNESTEAFDLDGTAHQIQRAQGVSLPEAFEQARAMMRDVQASNYARRTGCSLDEARERLVDIERGAARARAAAASSGLPLDQAQRVLAIRDAREGKTSLPRGVAAVARDISRQRGVPLEAVQRVLAKRRMTARAEMYARAHGCSQEEALRILMTAQEEHRELPGGVVRLVPKQAGAASPRTPAKPPSVVALESARHLQDVDIPLPAVARRDAVTKRLMRDGVPSAEARQLAAIAVAIVDLEPHRGEGTPAEQDEIELSLTEANGKLAELDASLSAPRGGDAA